MFYQVQLKTRLDWGISASRFIIQVVAAVALKP
jgi:hypothetical protein